MPRPSSNYKHLRARLITPVPYPPKPEATEKPQEPFPYPAHWTKGQLLNVRHNGTTFIVTTLEEEFDPQYPERAKFFDNSFDCQTFVSHWYNRDAADPRAG